MKKQFSCKETVVVNGFKTTRSIVTDDPSVAKTFLENSKVSDNSSKSKTKRTSNKDPGKTTSAKKKDSIKAEVKEIKPKSKSSKKEPKVKVLPEPKKMTVSEFRKKLRGMRKGTEEITMGSDVICKTGNGYGIRSKNNEPDPMTDYNPWTFGFKETWLINRYLRQGLLTK